MPVEWLERGPVRCSRVGFPGGAALHCWGGGAAETASSEKADNGHVTKVNHFYNGKSVLELCHQLVCPSGTVAVSLRIGGLFVAYSGLGVRSSSGCQYTAPESTASAASRSFLTLATAACAGLPVNRVMSPAFRIARSQSLRSAVKEISIAMYLVSVPSVASITRSAFLKLRWMSLGKTVSCHVAQVPGAEGSDELQTHVGRDVLGILDCPGSGEVSLEGTGVALYAIQPGVYVRMTRPLLLDKGLELDRELKQFLAQNACSDSLPPGWVGVEGSEEVVEGVDGRHGGDYTLFAAHWFA